MCRYPHRSQAESDIRPKIGCGCHSKRLVGEVTISTRASSSTMSAAKSPGLVPPAS